MGAKGIFVGNWWRFDLQMKYYLRLTTTAPSMAFHLCRKC